MRCFFCIIILFLIWECTNKKKVFGQVPIYKNPEKSTKQRVDDLLSLMTLDEKANFLTGLDMWHFKGIERLGIPSIQVTDCGHGVTVILDNEKSVTGNATCFPTATAQGATWNRELITELGKAIGRETLATGSRMILAPMVNIKRVPINGRNYEVFSEDPLLTGELAAAFINGVQSEKVGAVIKAITANNQQKGQSSLMVEMDERTLREIYLPQFKIAIEKSNPWGVMTAYNGVNGYHTSDNKHLLQEILKGEWRYDGFVVSDWRGVKSTDAITSGLDLEMPGPGKFLTKDNVLHAHEKGKLSEAQLNDMTGRILRAYVKAGILDENKPEYQPELNSSKHQMLARRISEEGIILLKNEGNLLPLKKSIKRLAVIGPNASEARLGGGGSASVNPFYSVSPLEGLKNMLPASTEIIFEEGCGLNGNLKMIESKYLRALVEGKEISGLKAEYFSNPQLKGEPAVRSTDQEINFSWGWANPKQGIGKNEYSIRWTGSLIPPETGVYKVGISGASCGFRLFIDGKLQIDEWEPKNTENFEADLLAISKHCSLALKKSVPVDIEIDFFKKSNRNFIRFEWEIPGSDSFELAKRAAEKADAVVFFAGLSNFFEGGNNDRADIVLPGDQDKLITELAKINQNIIVVLINGSPVAMPWIDKINAVVEAYYPGQEGGNAIANVLLGNINPSGKLPETFPVQLSDCIGMKNYPGENNIVNYQEGIFVGYRYYDKEKVTPLFPFGHGLSYTEFEYNNLNIEKSEDKLIVDFEIKNVGNFDGAEVVQLYIYDIVSSEPRPSKELKNFEKVFLRKGESKVVKFIVAPGDLSYFSETNKRWTLEPGEFELLIGSSSRDIRLRKIFNY